MSAFTGAGLYFLFSRLLDLHSPAAAQTQTCQREQIPSSLPHFCLWGMLIILGLSTIMPSLHTPPPSCCQILIIPSLHLPPHAAFYTSCESISLNQNINGKLPLLLTPGGFATPASDWVDPSDACTIPCLVLSSHLPSVDLRLRNGTEWRGIKRPDMKAGSLSLARRLPEHEPKGSRGKG